MLGREMHIEQNHTLGRDEARRRVESVAESLAGKYGLKTEWAGDDLNVSGNGMDGRIAITDDQVCVDAKLGFALKMLEGTIKSSIEEALEQHLA
ncbi:MAG: polyhydroxyalkanoic acid system family protein [Pseudomonadota bacterium]